MNSDRGWLLQAEIQFEIIRISDSRDEEIAHV